MALVAMSGACGDNSTNSAGDGIQVVATFYPLEWAARQVSGPNATITNLTPPGAEPHDLELTPNDTTSIADADVVVTLGGFQPAVDDAIDEIGAQTIVDASSVIDPLASPEDADTQDPHFWLDPQRMVAVISTIADALAKQDPSRSAEFRANAEQAISKLTALDADMAAALANCESTDIVTAHTAFSYLADRYGFTQVGISGIDPEAEPDPAQQAKVADFVRKNDVSTIYLETLSSAAVAESIAREVGADTAVLDPIEGLAEDADVETVSGEVVDYLTLMRANLAVLVKGQRCQ